MSKMIRVENCGCCPCSNHINGILKNSYCFELWVKRDSKTMKKVITKEFEIIDSEKILPNCPLEDYPETEREDTRKG